MAARPLGAACSVEAVSMAAATAVTAPVAAMVAEAATWNVAPPSTGALLCIAQCRATGRQHLHHLCQLFCSHAILHYSTLHLWRARWTGAVLSG